MLLTLDKFSDLLYIYVSEWWRPIQWLATMADQRSACCVSSLAHMPHGEAYPFTLDKRAKGSLLVSEQIRRSGPTPERRLAAESQEQNVDVHKRDVPVSGELNTPRAGAGYIAGEARIAILGHGRPMTRSQIVASLEARGISVGGVDKQRNMGTIMWRFRDKFVNIPHQGYWPADTPCPAVDYFPNGAKENDEQESKVE